MKREYELVRFDWVIRCVICAALALGFGACGGNTNDVSESDTGTQEMTSTDWEDGRHRPVQQPMGTSSATDTISESDADLVPGGGTSSPRHVDVVVDSVRQQVRAEVSDHPQTPEDVVNTMMGMLSTMMGGDGQQVDPEELMKFAFGILGEAAEQHQRQQEKIRKQLPQGWQDWPVEDVSGIYVKISAWDEEDAARISRDYYDGSYISDGWSYYARTSLSAGIYPITLGSAETSRLFHINGSEYYIYFDWLSDVDTGDVGVYDNTGFFGHFYKKPK